MLKSQILFNQAVATAYGDITFDEKGESKDLSDKEQKALGKLAYIDYIEDKKPAPKEAPKEETKEDVKEEPKEEPKEEKGSKGKTTNSKSTKTTKTTKKKTTPKKDKED